MKITANMAKKLGKDLIARLRHEALTNGDNFAVWLLPTGAKFYVRKVCANRCRYSISGYCGWDETLMVEALGTADWIGHMRQHNRIVWSSDYKMSLAQLKAAVHDLQVNGPEVDHWWNDKFESLQGQLKDLDRRVRDRTNLWLKGNDPLWKALRNAENDLYILPLLQYDKYRRMTLKQRRAHIAGFVYPEYATSHAATEASWTR